MDKLLRLAAVAAAFMSLWSCRKDSVDPTVYIPYDKVMILCAPAYNNLSSDIRENIKTICDSPLPLKSGNTAVLLFVHNSVGDYEWTTLTNPYIIRVYADWSGKAVMDTLMTFPKEAKMTDPAVLKQGLQFIADNFKSDSYGMIYSSHSTGWLPEEYYTKHSGKAKLLKPVPGEPKFKSFGAHYQKSGGSRIDYETDIRLFKDALPMHFDYIIFDCCLAGGVEVAYELKDKADRIAFSQIEIYSSGMYYNNATRHLLGGERADVAAFCKDYYAHSTESATISLVNTANLPHLAAVCKEIFTNNSEKLRSVNADSVQRFDRLPRHVMFDLEDILNKAQISDDEMAWFQAAMYSCIEYKAATKTAVASFDIKHCCGLSSYIPGQGDTTELHPFYRTLAWNGATGFVK